MAIDVSVKRFYNKVWIFLYILSVFLFFAPTIISLDLLKFLSFAIMLGSFIMCLQDVLFKKYSYSRYSSIMRLVLFMCFFTIANGFFLHDQGFLLGLRAMLEVLPFACFFLLYKLKIQIDGLEKIIRYATTLYIILFFIALALAPRIIFDATGSGDEFGVNATRGVARVKVLGVCFVHISLFIYINKWMVSRKNIYLAYTALMFLVIFLNVSRQHILVAVVLGILMITQKVKWAYKIPILVMSVLVINFIINNVAFVQKLITLSEDQIEEGGDENIRSKAFNYYMFQYNEGDMYKNFFGNGIANSASNWGMKVNFIKNFFGFVPSDVGYAKVFFYFGIAGFVVFFLLIFKMFKQKLPRELLYCKYYLAFIVFTNIGSHSFFTDIITFTFIIYIMDGAFAMDKFNSLRAKQTYQAIPAEV